MTISYIDIKNSLNKAYRLIKPRRKDLDNFKLKLTNLLTHIDEKESEENVKIHLMDFLKNTFFHPDHLIATNGRTDFVIHTSVSAQSPVGVMFEVKKPTNRVEMITKDNLNARAMHELILYFLRERMDKKNSSLTHLIITNIYEWFVFDATLFEKIFTQSKDLQKAYKEWNSGQKISSTTGLFYNEIVKPFLHELDKEISFAHFDIRNYEKNLRSKSDKDDNKLISLYKFFSPVHLLKLPFVNDSNSLDKGFFTELLHLIGLEEEKEGSKKIIRRLKEGKRNPGSILENTINILEVEDSIRKVPAKLQFGSNKEDRLFNLALDLSITWVNRILFLKLLEAQLLKYHNLDKKYRFLNTSVIRDYDELYKLFFQVLAKRNFDRTPVIQQKYGHIPYLNSSLFEISELEDLTIKVNALDDYLDIPIYVNSVIKKGVSKKDTSVMNTLHYFFEFLDAYDFASVGKEEIQEDNKTIINASVLGLVFEKINGYRDGSIYTPGAVTMFLCNETIRKAVIKKFNDTYMWKCQSIGDLKNHLADRRNQKDILEFNRILESVRVADPAVGSGHFLVSSLNELIVIKAELGIFADEFGTRIDNVDISIANDELVITDHKTQDFFEYSVNQNNYGKYTVSPDIQKIQQTLFNEKRNIIERCLFGVDINPNSVKICQLRLWIELLKHAYYNPSDDAAEQLELETLPNIDINIKQGNSLLSKYSLTEDLSDVFKKNQFGIATYKLAVQSYKDAPSKEAKEELRRFIKEIKENFHETVRIRDPRRKKLSELRGQQSLARNNFDLFGQKRAVKDMEGEVKKLQISIDKIELEISEIESNVIYKNAFEWRFEFPEVLDNNGDFEGFEVIIGNPPYIQLQKMGGDADALQKQSYTTFTRTGDIYCLFYEQAVNLLKPGYFFGYITSNKWMRANYGQATRRFFLDNTNPLLLVDFGGYQVFDSATVDTNILLAQKGDYTGKTETCLIDKSLGSIEKMSVFISQNKNTVSNLSKENGWVILNDIEAKIKRKIEEKGTPLKHWDVQINYGIKTGFNEAFIIDAIKREELLENCPEADEIIRPILRGREIHKYWIEKNDQYLLFIPWHFPLQHDATINGSSRVAEEKFESDFSSIYEHLKGFKDKLSQRNQSETGIRYEWYALQRFGSNYSSNFQMPKIIYPNMTKFLPFYYDNEGNYLNDKCFMITGKHLGYLTAFLNSSIFKFCFRDIFPELQGGTRELRKIFFETIRVLEVSDLENELFKTKIEEIQDNKKNGLPTSELELRIDNLLFDKYDLTTEERTAIGFIDIL